MSKCERLKERKRETARELRNNINFACDYERPANFIYDNFEVNKAPTIMLLHRGNITTTTTTTPAINTKTNNNNTELCTFWSSLSTKILFDHMFGEFVVVFCFCSLSNSVFSFAFVSVYIGNAHVYSTVCIKKKKKQREKKPLLPHCRYVQTVCMCACMYGCVSFKFFFILYFYKIVLFSGSCDLSFRVCLFHSLLLLKFLFLFWF